MLRALLLLSLIAPPALGEGPTGTVAGQVRFTGTPPPAQTIMVTDGTTIEHRDLIVDPKSQGLAGVFVQLEDAPARPPLPKAEPVPVDQRDWVFVPRVVAVQHGRPVRFDNNDSVNHSVQAMSLKQPANEFNRTAGPGTPIVHTFAPQEGPVIIGCGLHAWMRAYVYVVPHPWFAVTDAEGKFRLAEVPPGKYVLLATHPDTGLKERRAVTVAAGQTTEVAVTWTKVR